MKRELDPGHRWYKQGNHFHYDRRKECSLRTGEWTKRVVWASQTHSFCNTISIFCGKKYSAILKIICLNSWNFTKIFYLDIIKGTSVQLMFLDVCYFTSRWVRQLLLWTGHLLTCPDVCLACQTKSSFPLCQAEGLLLRMQKGKKVQFVVHL